MGCAKTLISFIWNLYETTRNNEGKARHEATWVGKGYMIKGPRKSYLGFEFHSQLSNGNQ